jgi:hypothetical protein
LLSQIKLVPLHRGLDPERQLSDAIVAHALELGVIGKECGGGDVGGADRGGSSGDGGGEADGDNGDGDGDNGNGDGDNRDGDGDNGDGVEGRIDESVISGDDDGGGGGGGAGAVSRPLTLGDVFDAVSRAAKLLPVSSDTLYVEYEWQRDGSVIGQSSFPHDADWLERRVRRHLAFWDGTRKAEGEEEQEEKDEENGGEKDGAPAAAAAAADNLRNGVFGVSDEEAWKCERCRFSRDCPTAAVFAERWHTAQAH